MQVWEKIGLVYHNNSSDYSYATLPIALTNNKDVLTVFYSARNKNNQSLPFSLSLNMNSLSVSDLSKSHLLSLGSPGEFDSDGIMPTCIIPYKDKLYMYYIGWNTGTTVPFRNAIGLAHSNDGGKTFVRSFNGPIMDRSIYDPCFVASCDVMKLKDGFGMWYLSAIKWEKAGTNWKHFYHIKYATSKDLIHWKRKGQIAIDFKAPCEYAISTPRVLMDKSGLYKMWYSYRGSHKAETYRIGYAESANGINWIRMDDELILPVSETGWDSKMICYPFLFNHNSNLYMLYNGNEYGKSGFGLAILRKN
jgi:hypothetical protein